MQKQNRVQDLIKMVSAGFVDGFYIKPRVDDELLKRSLRGLSAYPPVYQGRSQRSLCGGDYQGKRCRFEVPNIFGEETSI